MKSLKTYRYMINSLNPMTQSPLPLKINQVTKKYGSLVAVDRVSFEIKEGEIFGLLGPNGAGKTSIISMITTLEDPTEGDLSVFGYNVQKDPISAKMLTGCVPQELINYGFFNVQEILRFQSGYYGRAHNEERVQWLITKLALHPHKNKRVKELSGGLKKRLLIAKALVHEPKLLLLDEPTAGVDIDLRELLWQFVLDLKKKGVSILLTTHYLEEAEFLCDRVGFLDQGKLKVIGKTEEIVKELTERQVVIILKAPKGKIIHKQLRKQVGLNLIFRIPNTKNVIELIEELGLKSEDVFDIKIREGSLEDVFQTVLGKSNGKDSDSFLDSFYP